MNAELQKHSGGLEPGTRKIIDLVAPLIRVKSTKLRVYQRPPMIG